MANLVYELPNELPNDLRLTKLGIANLTNNKTIKVLKQDKGRGVVIMDSSKCTEKCLGSLENDRFAKINNDPTKRIESKTERCVCKLKSKITE